MPKKEKELSEFEKKLNIWVTHYLSRVKTVQKILFISHLKTMVKAGLSLIEALKNFKPRNRK